jgi:hypothetical protein
MIRWTSLILLLATAPYAQALEAGAAIVDITPPLGTPLNGYADRLGQGSTSVHDPLTARGLYLSDGETNLFLVTVDLCVINSELRQAVLKVAPTVVPPERIILTATHNHNGTGAMVKPLVFRAISGPYMPSVLNYTADQIASAMYQAYENRQRATIGYGTTTQLVLSENRSLPGGPTDQQIGVIRVDDPDGNAIAIAGNFAAHPTTVPEEDRFAISADYPGFYYEALEAMAEEGCVAMFLNGAEGDQACGNPEDNEGWARSESIGRLLAIRVKEVANQIEGNEATLHVGYTEEHLPPTIGAPVMPTKTILQTLEFDGLLVTFVPGEPCVDIGLQLRRQSMAAGYKAQFTVGLANDHLLYITPESFYGLPTYESAMSFYGPRMDQWLYRHFAALATLTEAEPLQHPPTVAASVAGPGAHIQLAGPPYDQGYGRGVAFRDDVTEAYDRDIRQPLASGDWMAQDSPWRFLPPFVDKATLGLARRAMDARPELQGVLRPAREELAGIAEGAGLPFDAVWLLQAVHPGAAQESPDHGATMFAVESDQRLLVAHNVPGDARAMAVITEVIPAKGHRYIHVGYPWILGVTTGMNEAGIVACVEWTDPIEPTRPGNILVGLAVREVLEQADTVSEASDLLVAQTTHIQGCRVLLAGPGEQGAMIVDFNDEGSVRAMEGGAILGQSDESSADSDPTSLRYARVAKLVAASGVDDIAEAYAVLRDHRRGPNSMAAIYNGSTRFSIVFEPASRRLHVSFPASKAEFSDPITFSLSTATPTRVDAP